MKISEVSKHTKLSQKTIRYYEERDLIAPTIKMIQERKFRDYDKNTIDQLTSIATLRALLFTIEEIKIMIEHPEKIEEILFCYENRMQQELNERVLILNTLPDIRKTCIIKNMNELSANLTKLSNQYKLPACDLNPDFSHMDETEITYQNQKKHRIYTRFSVFSKKVNAIELFVLELLWNKETLDFSTITRQCMQKGIFTDSDYIKKLLKRMCKRKLIQYKDGLFTPLVSFTDIEFRDIDMMLQTAYNGSPDKMIYTPPATPTSFGRGV